MPRRITIPFITLSLLLTPRLGLAQGTLLWQQNVNGTSSFHPDSAQSVAVDTEGNVLAAGSTWTHRADFTVVKFARDGTLLWRQTINGTADFDDVAYSLAVDNQGNVLAAGGIWNRYGVFNDQEDFTVVKFARDGTLLWQQTLNGTANANSGEARSVAVDTQGNVLAAGYTENTGTGRDFTVAKFTPDGTLLWHQTLNGTANGDDEAYSVAVDTKGNVLAAGVTRNTGTGTDFTVAKFAGDGTLLWQQTLNGTANGFEEARSVAVDTQGNVLAAGVTENSFRGEDFTVAKFAPDGTLLWQQALNGTANVDDEAFSVAVDTQGNVLAAGYTENTGTGQDFTVVKFARDGTLWQQVLNGTANGSDEARSVAVDTQGNVLAAGYTENTGTGRDFTVAKFAPDGTGFWQQSINGPAATSSKPNDAAFAVTVDAEGNVLAAGFTQSRTSSTSHAFTVAKFAGMDDVTPPTLLLPTTIVVDATSPAGATVTYTVSATDDVDPNPVVICSPPSGSVFPLLASTVSCTATDAAGNSATETFQVVVLDARQQLQETIDLIASYQLTRLGTSLPDKLQLASGYIAFGDIGEACGVLTGFLNQVRAQAGKALTVDQATELTMRANRIRNVIGC